MEGLIPFLFHALKKNKRSSNGYRSLSAGSTRSYHLLTATENSFEGSSHRRTRSDFQPPTMEFLQQRSILGLAESSSFNHRFGQSSSPVVTGGSGFGFYREQTAKKTADSSNLRR